MRSQAECGGFFFSAKYRMSDHIRANASLSEPRPALLNA